MAMSDRLLSPRRPRNAKNLSLNLGPATGPTTGPTAAPIPSALRLAGTDQGFSPLLSTPTTSRSRSPHGFARPPDSPQVMVAPMARFPSGAFTPTPTRESFHTPAPSITSLAPLPFMQRPPPLTRKSTLTLAIPLFPGGSMTSLKPSAVSSAHLAPEPRAGSPSEDSYFNYLASPRGEPQTLLHSFNDLDLAEFPTAEETLRDAYPEGPKEVHPNLYLYSEPTLTQACDFDLIINVARELPDRSREIAQANAGRTRYVFQPWSHTLKLATDLAFLTGVMAEYLRPRSGIAPKVLVHCQCGVSRSATLIVAYLMSELRISVTDGYTRLKAVAPRIAPNMGLIFQLMEWAEMIGVAEPSPNTPVEFLRKMADADSQVSTGYN